MSTKLNTQSPNCHHSFTNQSFQHHIRACKRAINDNTASGIGIILANPLLSVGNTSISRQLSTSASDANDLQPLEEVQDNYFDFVNNHSEGQDGEEFAFVPSNKEQVSVNNSLDNMLHDLLLKHKASLLLYDEISNLLLDHLPHLCLLRYH